AMAGKTVIAIAHRLSTVMDMDRLIVLDRGVIVADGPHEELLLQGGLYAELWRKQSGQGGAVTALGPRLVGSRLNDGVAAPEAIGGMPIARAS
ncbi:MAG: hypothetical protein ACREUG_14955, partial [Steroidobacteraceae bacterium]